MPVILASSSVIVFERLVPLSLARIDERQFEIDLSVSRELLFGREDYGSGREFDSLESVGPTVLWVGELEFAGTGGLRLISYGFRRLCAVAEPGQTQFEMALRIR